MAKKIQKKIKPASKSGSKSFKPASKAQKPGKSAVGAALKKVAKSIASAVAKPAKNTKSAPSKPAKKAALLQKVAKVKGKPASAAKPAKVIELNVGKKSAASPDSVSALPATGKGKKKSVVVELPAPKGVALLGKDIKRKGKGSDSGAAMMSSKKRCREPACDLEGPMQGFCRSHYIKNWRKIKRKEAIIASGQLNNYVEELVSKYPDKYLDVIRQDLSSEKDWAKVVSDLELESSEDEASGEEDIEGVVSDSGSSGRREREFDDEGDSF